MCGDNHLWPSIRIQKPDPCGPGLIAIPELKRRESDLFAFDMLGDGSVQLILRAEADYLRHWLTALEQNQCGDTLHAKALRRIRLGIHVHLTDA